jgi:hypothetical protein
VIALSLSRSSACGNTVFRDFQDFFPFFPALEFTELNFLMRRVGVDRIELVALGQGWIEADIFLPLVKEVHPIIERCDSLCHDFLLLSWQ